MRSAAADQLLQSLRDIIQVDVGNRGLARDSVDNLITACPDDFANACKSIADHPSPHVGIVTGFMIPTVEPPTGETDGPLGALFLAGVFQHIGIRCVFCSDTAGLNALEVGRGLLQLRGVPLIALPMSTNQFIIPSDVTHLIALERSGPARADGRNHTMRGRDITHLTAPAQFLFEGPRSYVTIGIGDGGNEIGMGKIPFATICKNIPNGEMIACRTATDHLIVAGVSNWGAYALAAGIMLLKRSVDTQLFDPDGERSLLENMVEYGPLVDGVTGQRTATVDGLSWGDYAKPLEQIRQLLANAATLT